MNNAHTEGQPIGQISSGIDQSMLLLRTINFVRQQLPTWRDDPDRPQKKAENKLNLQLCKYLDSYARNYFPMVRFDHEEYQSDRRSVDLSASLVEATVIGARQYTIYDPILVLECKRLPAPSKDREKEYVSGGKENTSGGIQRFKLGQHSANLDQAIMIGYIQERTARDWHYDVNCWISAFASSSIEDICVWNTSEILRLIDEDALKGIASYLSVHSRTNSTFSNEIKIHHFWIAMNKV